jgi:tetratricopeptide (TPR) repeat protein
LLAAEGFYKKALNAYEWALQTPPINPRDNAPAHRGKGDTFYYHREYKRADQAYDQALECYDRDPLAYNGKGLIANSRKDYEGAIGFYNRAIELDPNCALAYLNKGYDLQKIGAREAEIHRAFERAVDAFNLLLRNEEEEKAIWYYYQVPALQELGRSNDAKRAEVKARELGYRKKSRFNIDLF